MKGIRWSILLISCALLFGYGFVYGGIVFDMWRAMYPKVQVEHKGLWPPANEIQRGECVLPDIDMRNARELLPREVHNAAYLFEPEAEKLVDVDGWQITETEAAIVKHTNDYRVRNGRKPLKVSRKLMGTSRLQSWHMARRRTMQHGFTSGWRAENIAMNGGGGSPQSFVNMWVQSSGHRANLLGAHTYIGVASYGGYATQQFE